MFRSMKYYNIFVEFAKEYFDCSEYAGVRIPGAGCPSMFLTSAHCLVSANSHTLGSSHFPPLTFFYVIGLFFCFSELRRCASCSQFWSALLQRRSFSNFVSHLCNLFNHFLNYYSIKQHFEANNQQF